MKKVYIKCSNCDGQGIVNTLPRLVPTTTAGDGTYAIQCPKCLGTGKLETDYFIEE